MRLGARGAHPNPPRILTLEPELAAQLEKCGVKPGFCLRCCARAFGRAEKDLPRRFNAGLKASTTRAGDTSITARTARFPDSGVTTPIEATRSSGLGPVAGTPRATPTPCLPAKSWKQRPQPKKSRQNLGLIGFTGKIPKCRELRAGGEKRRSPWKTRIDGSKAIIPVIKPSTDTTGQERRARRILPYGKSMGVVEGVVKITKVQVG
jgi:hypothetical protein